MCQFTVIRIEMQPMRDRPDFAAIEQNFQRFG